MKVRSKRNLLFRSFVSVILLLFSKTNPEVELRNRIY